MPWCEECAKYWTPNAMRDDGRCPKCGDDLAEQVSPAARQTAVDSTMSALTGERSATGTSAPGSEVDESTPWHFKLMVAMVTLYLGWRVVEIFV